MDSIYLTLGNMCSAETRINFPCFPIQTYIEFKIQLFRHFSLNFIFLAFAVFFWFCKILSHLLVSIKATVLKATEPLQGDTFTSNYLGVSLIHSFHLERMKR